MPSVFDDLKPSSTLYINETVNQRWAQGKEVFHLGFGESRFEVHEILQSELAKYADQKSYLPAQGLPELCDAVAKYYSHHLASEFKASQVIVGPGSKLLIYGIQMALAADLFLPTPSWVSYAPQAQLLGLKHVYIPSKVENNYQFDLQEFDRLVQASENPNKLLVLNTPNNPSGQMLDEHTLREIADYCRSNGIWVLSDEIYFRVTHTDQAHRSIAEFYPEGTFVLGGLSKHLSIGGWRLGVALLPDNELGRALMQRLVIISSETWSGVAAPIQYACIRAYQDDPAIEAAINECANIHAMRSAFIRQQLVNLGVACPEPQGAFYLIPNFDRWKDALAKKGVSTSADLSRFLIDHYSLATLPAEDFGVPAETLSLRLSTSYLDMEQSGAADRVVDLYRQGVSKEEFMSEQNHPNTNKAMQAFARFIADL